MKIIVFIQARMSSKRLPGKVMLKIKNKSILEHVVYNLKKSKSLEDIVVLTSKKIEDQKIVNLCNEKNILYYRGDLNNVYKRFFNALQKFKCDAFVRICADSPLINHKILDLAIKKFKTKKFDIVTNCFPKTFSKGLSVEILKTDIFLKSFKQIKNQEMKEHITKYFYENKKKFKIFNINNKKKLKYKNLAVDDIDDYNFIKKNFKKLCF